MTAPPLRTYIYAAMVATVTVMLQGSPDMAVRALEFCVNYATSFLVAWWLISLFARREKLPPGQS